MSSTNHQSILDRVFAKSGLEKAAQTALIDRFAAAHTGAPALDPAEVTKGLQKAATVIDTIPAEGLLIAESGHYTLAADVSWAPGLLARAAVVIIADDVTFDLGGHNLSIELGAEDLMTAAILVLGGNGVTVTNGMILNAGYRGVWSEFSHGLTISDLTVSGQTFNDVVHRSRCPAGIYVSGGKDVTISTCTVQYSYVTADVMAGVMLVGTIGARVTGCAVTDLVNYDGSVQGFCSYVSADLAWADCHALRLQSFFNGNIRTGGHTVLGFMPCLSAGLTVTDCSATNIIGSRDDCHGMSIFICADANATGFRAKTVVGGPAPYLTGAKATGLEVYGWGVEIADCAASDIRATEPQDRQAAAFSAWGKGITFTGCEASDVQVLNAAGTADASCGYGVGFGWAPDPRPMFCNTSAEGVIYKACSAKNCQVGFDTWYHVNSVWEDVTATDCGTAILKQTNPPAQRTLFADPASECNPPITVTLTNKASGNTVPDLTGPMQPAAA